MIRLQIEFQLISVWMSSAPPALLVALPMLLPALPPRSPVALLSIRPRMALMVGELWNRTQTPTGKMRHNSSRMQVSLAGVCNGAMQFGLPHFPAQPAAHPGDR